MEKASRLFHNGTIVTMDSSCSQAEALAVRGDRIMAVGRKEDIMNLKGPDTLVTDLGGRTMLPGFVDGHSHIVSTGQIYFTMLDLTSPPVGTVASIKDILHKIREKAATLQEGEWILGFGYDDTLLEESRHPLAEELDRAAPHNPVLLQHVSGHLCTCNSRALALGKVSRDTPNPVGGNIRRREDGSPSGVLEEPPAMTLVSAHIPDMGHEDWLKALKLASQTYAAKGVTSAQDGWTEETGWQLLKQAHTLADAPLSIRVQILPGAGKMDLGQFSGQSGQQLTPDCMLSLGAAKILADGSLQGYTGYLSNPYHKVIYDLPGGALWRGYPMQSPLDLQEQVMDLHCRGWQLAIHGNGDDAIQNILNAMEEAHRRYPRADARHIIIHCQTVREDQLDRIRRLGIVPSFFVLHTYYWGDRHYETFLGPDRAQRISPLKSALNRNIPFSTHCDTFVTPMDPLLSVWAAVNRQTSGGRVLGRDQTIPVLDALRSVTSWAAYQACEERLKGSLEPGKLADMVVLEQNPLTVAPMDIRHIPIAATLVGGKEVFGAL